MDYEKKYKEALERARQFSEKPYLEDSKGIVDYIFPELKESEDERVRRVLREIVLQWKNGHQAWCSDDKEIDTILAWLEKQGEHAKFCDSIQVGDKVTRNEDGVLVNLSQLKRVAKKDEKQGEQKPVELDDTNAKRMFIKALERVEEQNNKGYKLTDCDKNSWWEDFKAYTSCIIEQKPAWNEEDEKAINDIMWIIEAYRKNSFNETHIQMADNSEKWLKSLKDRYTWKPSDEQMGVIEAVINNRSFQRRHLDSLYNDLKKLKGG